MRITTIVLVALLAACTDGNRCGPGTRAVGNACVPTLACPDGYLSQGDECIPLVGGCAAGSTLQAGVCVPDVTACGDGAVLENGACVPIGLPDADVTESLDPAVPAEVELPQTGSVSLGGRVDAPEDLDGDSYVDPDYDNFVFYAEAGTWLRIRATSDGAALPAFLILSTLTGEDGRPLYSRYAIEPNADVTVREVYLPRSDTYVLWVTDFAHLWPYFFGWPTVPVGGDSFTYRVVIENLGAPTPTAVSDLPWSDNGDLSDGGLRFYELAPSDDVAVLARSLGEPNEDEPSEVYTILTAFADDGSFAGEAQPRGLSLDVDLLLPGERGHLLVQDHLLVMGPQREFAVQIDPIVPIDCTTGCTGAASNDHVMYAWSLDAGDFLAAGVAHDSYDGLDLALVDIHLDPLLPRQRVQRGVPGHVALYADQPRDVYLWLQKQKGATIESYTIDETVLATPLLDAETVSTHEVAVLPDAVMPDSGIVRLAASAGQLVLFDPLTTYGGAWAEPTESLLGADLTLLGPATDVLDGELGTFAPLAAVLPADGTYLHVVHDETGEVAGSSYDTRFVAATPITLAATTVDTPTVVSGVLSAGVAVLAHTGAPWQRAAIEVTTDGFRPEVWVLNRGKVTSLYPEYYWQADDNELGLGRVAAAVGDSNTVLLDHVAFGVEDLVVIRDADGGASGSFDATIQVFAPPANDTCAGAELLDLTSGAATVLASTAGATDTLDLDWQNPCTSRPSQGPDRYYAIDVTAGDTLDVTITGEHASVIYLLDACGGTCLAGASGGNQSFTWTAEANGRVIIGVDGYAPTSLGDFSLEIQRR